MVFSSLTFLCLFLPVFLIVYFVLPKLRTVSLVAFSLVFYAFGEPVWVLALILSGIVNYALGLAVSRPRGGIRRAALALSIILNLGLLGTVKYAGFIITNVNALIGTGFTVPGLALPLGISFYTFQAISYVIDIYRGSVPPQRSALKFLAYLTMFPQLVAGPIVRYPDIRERLGDMRMTLPDFSSGVTRFAVGLGKKVLLADAAGSAASALLDGGVKLTAAGSWLGMLFFMFQIYFDFSGYSDMAIGLGRMLGFEFRENFNYPYTARSVTDFWRRWHISLSSFFRDYVYIPLGGNRRHQILNLAVVWLLTGLWHGASWNFILWGLYYGLLLVIEKRLLLRVLERLPPVVRHIYTLAAVVVGWAMFYFTSGEQLIRFARAAVGIGVSAYDVRAVSVLGTNLFLLPVLIIGCTPLPRVIAERIKKRAAAGILEPAMNAAIMITSFITIIGQSYNPFLYFRF